MNGSPVATFPILLSALAHYDVGADLLTRFNKV